MKSCSLYNLAPNDILCNTYTQVKVTKKNNNLVIKKFVLSVTQVFRKTTSFPVLNRYIRLKGACCCHIQGLCSPRRNISWRQQDLKNISNCLTTSTNCINIDQLEKYIHSPWYVLLRGWLRNKYHVNIILFIRPKYLFIIFLENISGVKHCQSFTSLGSWQSRQVIYLTNNIINLLHQPNAVSNVYKY